MARILIWSPNYAPELTGIPPLVTDAAEWLAARGHEVDVVTAHPNYPEREIDPEYRGALWRTEQRGQVRVHRSWLRVRPGERFLDKVLYELSFATLSSPLAFRHARRADVVVAVVPSLLAATYAAYAARRRVVLWVQDLVLEAAASVRGADGVAARLISAARRVERGTARRAARVVVCSPGFRDYFVERGVPEGSIAVVPNWVDVEGIRPAEPPGRARARFLYSGNLGYTQGFETLVEAARLAGDRVEVEIVGAGNAAENVRSLAATAPNVQVSPTVPEPDFPGLLANADAHVVVQRRVSAGANLPSKIGPYLASGRPVLASIAAETQAAELLRQSGGARLVAPEDPAALARAMVELADDAGLRRALGAKGREFAERELAREHVLPRLERELLGR